MKRRRSQSHEEAYSRSGIRYAVESANSRKEENRPSPELQAWGKAYMDLDKEKFGVRRDYVLTSDQVISAIKGDVMDEGVYRDQVDSFEAGVENRFCLMCRILFEAWSDLTMHNLRFRSSSGIFTMYGLEASTRQGCQSCAFIRQCMILNGSWEIYRKIEARLASLQINTEISIIVRNIDNPSESVRQILWPSVPGKTRTWLATHEASLYTNCISSVAVPITGSTSTQQLDPAEDISTRAKRWMKACVDDHEECRVEQDSIFPTRLIAVTTDPPRLVVTATFNERPRYATLSHCWGGDIPSKLTASSLNSRFESMPLNELPKSFKDAISFACQLNVHYIWIDSLCIIQDDEEDWRREASLMCSVYGGATLNIAAYSASDSTKGCFLQAPDFQGEFRAEIVIDGRKQTRSFSEYGFYEKAINQSILASRAWTLQERILSPRTIYLGNRGAIWECNKTILSEFSSHKIDVPVSLDGVDKTRLKSSWPYIVSLYSSANLTFPDDKLPALSGIARETYKQSKDQYIAGMWRIDFERQLCWHIAKTTGSHPTTRPPGRSGSWSWTSVDGPVDMSMTSSKEQIELYMHMMETEIETLGNDPFGQITRAILKLSCTALVPLNSSANSSMAGDTMELQTRDLKSWISILIDCTDDYQSFEKEPSFLLLVFSALDAYHYVTLGGFILKETGSRKGEFRRIGFFSGDEGNNPNNSRWQRPMNGLFESCEESGSLFHRHLVKSRRGTSEAHCAEVITNEKYPAEQYVITIV